MLQARTEEQLKHIASILGVEISRCAVGEYPIHTLEIDDAISFDQMAEIVDYLRNEEERTQFTVRWLSENIDMNDYRLKDSYNNHVEVQIEDNTTDDGKDAGCIDIIYCGQIFWTLSKGTDGVEWLASVSEEFRNDSWIPSVKSIADFKRLFRVAAGFDIPLKK